MKISESEKLWTFLSFEIHLWSRFDWIFIDILFMQICFELVNSGELINKAIFLLIQHELLFEYFTTEDEYEYKVRKWFKFFVFILSCNVQSILYVFVFNSIQNGLIKLMVQVSVLSSNSHIFFLTIYEYSPVRIAK